MRWAKRRDVNEGDIVNALVARGAHVTKLGDAGAPDLLVGYAGRWFLLEVKIPIGSKGGGRQGAGGELTTAQEKWWGSLTDACGPRAIVRTPEEALAAIGWPEKT